MNELLHKAQDILSKEGYAQFYYQVYHFLSTIDNWSEENLQGFYEAIEFQLKMISPSKVSVDFSYVRDFLERQRKQGGLVE